MAPADHDLGSLGRLADLDDVRLQPGPVLVALVGDLLGLGEERLHLPEIEERVPVVRLLDDAGDDVPLAAGVLLVLEVPLDLADALEDHLLGRLGRDPTEVVRGVVQLADDIALFVELLAVDADLPGVGIDRDHSLLRGVRTTLVGHHQGVARRRATSRRRSPCRGRSGRVRRGTRNSSCSWGYDLLPLLLLRRRLLAVSSSCGRRARLRDLCRPWLASPCRGRPVRPTRTPSGPGRCRRRRAAPRSRRHPRRRRDKPSASEETSVPRRRHSPGTWGRVLTETVEPTALAKCAGVRSVRSIPGIEASSEYRPGMGSTSSSRADTARLASVRASQVDATLSVDGDLQDPRLHLDVHQFEAGLGHHRGGARRRDPGPSALPPLRVVCRRLRRLLGSCRYCVRPTTSRPRPVPHARQGCSDQNKSVGWPPTPRQRHYTPTERQTEKYSSARTAREPDLVLLHHGPVLRPRRGPSGPVRSPAGPPRVLSRSASRSSPVARERLSTIPRATPLAPTTSRIGTPRRSASANLTPGDTSLSSYRTSIPAAEQPLVEGVCGGGRPRGCVPRPGRRGGPGREPPRPATPRPRSSWCSSARTESSRDTPMP